MVLPIEGEMPKGRGGLKNMKQNYIKPEINVEEIILESTILSGSLVDIDPNGSGIATANERRGTWGDLWE